MSMRLLVSGTRHEHPKIKDLVRDELDFYFDEWGINLFLILGDARGVDAYAKEWAEMREVDYVILHAKWEAFGKPAGMIRNREMLKFNPDKAIVFPASDSKGTVGMIQELNKRGIKPRKVSVTI